MNWRWKSFKQRIRSLVSRRSQNGMDPDLLKQMARGIMTTRRDEIACDECFEHIDRYVEMTLDGTDPTEALGLVQDHLSRCRDCREEFEALQTAVAIMTK